MEYVIQNNKALGKRQLNPEMLEEMIFVFINQVFNFENPGY